MITVLIEKGLILEGFQPQNRGHSLVSGITHIVKL